MKLSRIKKNCIFIFLVVSLLLSYSITAIAQQINNDNCQECAIFDIMTKRLYIPSVRVGEKSYWLDLRLNESSAAFDILSIGETNYSSNQCYSTFDPSDNILHIPCLRFNNDLYSIELQLYYGNPAYFRLATYARIDKSVESLDHIVLTTYNILGGAGVDEVFQSNKDWAAQHGYPGNRLPQIIEIIEKINPDIIGIQEANQWDRGNPPVVQRVGTLLGMNYFLGKSGSSDAGFAHVALFTKYHILEAESYPSEFTRAALRARLALPTGQILNVFVVHLDSLIEETRQKEARFIVEKMAPYLNEFSIIMGDFNFCDGCWGKTGDILRDGGWYHQIGPYIDQMWVSSKLKDAIHKLSIKDIPYDLLRTASDHMPVAATLVLP